MCINVPNCIRIYPYVSSNLTGIHIIYFVYFHCKRTELGSFSHYLDSTQICVKISSKMHLWRDVLVDSNTRRYTAVVSVFCEKPPDRNRSFVPE